MRDSQGERESQFQRICDGEGGQVKGTISKQTEVFVYGSLIGKQLSMKKIIIIGEKNCLGWLRWYGMKSIGLEEKSKANIFIIITIIWNGFYCLREKKSIELTRKSNIALRVVCK